MIPRGTFSSVGGALGGAPGRMIGSGLSALTGFGKYNQRLYTGEGAYDGDDESGPHNNDRMRLQSNVLTQDVPIVSNPQGDDGGVCIRHREYLRDVVSTGGGFNMAAAISINPGNPACFPWLSAVAGQFCQYKIKGMMFEFVSTSGALSTTRALGEIVMAVNYNAVEPAFVNKQQMLNEVFSVSKVPSENALCPIECDARQTPIEHMYVRGAAVPGNEDPRFYDFGKFYIATQGQSAPVALGELWVTYQIELYKPQLPRPPPLSTSFTRYRSTPAVSAAASIIGGTGGVALLSGGNPYNIIPSGGNGSASGTVTFQANIPVDSTVIVTVGAVGLSIGGNIVVACNGGVQSNIWGYGTRSIQSATTPPTSSVVQYAFNILQDVSLFSITAPPGFGSGNVDIAFSVYPSGVRPI